MPGELVELTRRSDSSSFSDFIKITERKRMKSLNFPFSKFLQAKKRKRAERFGIV